jgi:hypothetical protein
MNLIWFPSRAKKKPESCLSFPAYTLCKKVQLGTDFLKESSGSQQAVLVEQQERNQLE